MTSPDWPDVQARAYALLSKEWDESKHPREPAGSPEGGQFAGGGGAEGKPPSTWPLAKPIEIDSAIQEQARENHVGPEHIIVTPEEKQFTLQNTVMDYAGSYEFGSPNVKLYSKHLSAGFVRRVLSHEIEHLKFDRFQRRYRAELDAVLKEPAPTKEVMRADGLLKPPYDEKYPVYQAWTKLWDLDELRKSDGTTDYSKAWWKEFEAGKTASDIPVHETLAEMAAQKQMFGNLGIANADKRWKDMFKLVNDTWEKIPADEREAAYYPRGGPHAGERIKAITHEVIDGRGAAIADFYGIKKIIFDDGEIVFAVPRANVDVGKARALIAGRKATFHYFDKLLNPTNRERATFLKAIYLNGEEFIARREGGAWQRFNPYHEPAGSPEGGQFTTGGGEAGGGEPEPLRGDDMYREYHHATNSEHIGVSGDFDLRPNQPMPSQSIIVTVKSMSGPTFSDVAVNVNPTIATTKKIIRNSDFAGARALQDRAGNIFMWDANDGVHYQMMDALAPVETMWASDQFENEKGKVVSMSARGTDRAQEWIAHGLENNRNADKVSAGFVSPNVKTDLDFKGAVEALTSPQQGSLLAASTAIDQAVGLKNAKEANIIGAWADGAENSIMMTAGADWDHTVLATVMKGHLADQKSVLVFQNDRRGDSVLASFHADGSLEQIHKQLLADGLANHTLVPSGQDGATVYVADLDGSAADAIEKASERYDSKVNIQYGRAEFIGDTSGEGSDREQRDRARGIFEKIIRESPVSGSQTIWADIRNRWGATEQIKQKFNPYHEPGGSPEGGQFAHGPGGGEGGTEKEPADKKPVDGTSNYGLVPGDVEKFHALKTEWAQVNAELLTHVDQPDGPESKALIRHLEAIVHEIQGLHADPGTPEGIGLPGGPRDVTVVGAGPGGLAASINGAAEGLDTLVVEANVVAGGQAKFSSRIENFPGFPIGVTGERLTQNMFSQAQRLGASTELGIRVTSMTYDSVTGMKHLTLSDGTKIDSRTVIVAGGVEFNRLTFPGSEGPGVIVGDGKELAKEGKGGNIIVVGGSNGAAQAALGCVANADHIYLMSRGPITDSMSDYQVVAVRNNPKITVIEGDSIVKLNRDDKGQPVSVETKNGKTIPCKAVGEFIGSMPDTKWVPSNISRDNRGRINTNQDLETQIPGVFAVGDIRGGAIGRVGVAVGEGQLALRQANVYLDKLRKKSFATRANPPAASKLITDLFDLDIANPWFGQTWERHAGQTIKQKFNPYHEPAGSPTGGQFTTGGGEGGDSGPKLPAAKDVPEYPGRRTGDVHPDGKKIYDNRAHPAYFANHKKLEDVHSLTTVLYRAGTGNYYSREWAIPDAKGEPQTAIRVSQAGKVFASDIASVPSSYVSDPFKETIALHHAGLRTPLSGDIEQTKAVKKEWIAQSPVKSMEDAKRLAPPAQHVLNAAGREIEKSIPGVKVKYAEHKLANPRGEQRIKDKALERADRGGIAAISDLARIAFTIDHPDASDKIIAELAKRFETAAEPWKMTPVFYTDRAANVRMPNGVIGEVQMMNAEMQTAKKAGGGHKYYEISRRPGMEEKDKPAYDAAIAKQREIYGAVIKNAPPEWRDTFANATRVKYFFEMLLRAMAERRQTPNEKRLL